MPSSYGSGGSSSSRPAPKISYSSSSGSSVTETKYRSGTSDGFYTTIKDVPSSRGGSGVVLIQTKK